MIEIINRAFKKIQCADYASPQGKDALLYLESKKGETDCVQCTNHTFFYI